MVLSALPGSHKGGKHTPQLPLQWRAKCIKHISLKLLVSMNHEVNTFYPKDSSGDKSLSAFHSYLGGRKKKKKRRKTTTKNQQVSHWHLGGVLHWYCTSLVLHINRQRTCKYQSAAHKDVSQYRLATKFPGDPVLI